MREIALDTETTGLNPTTGDRIVEIGCVELKDHVATEKSYHQYVNPERPMPKDALEIHGLTDEFLVKQPVMSEVVDEFLDFIGDANLVIHNAEFDIRFINAELNRLGKAPLEINRALDTVQLARAKYPGAPASLDALCKRFNIDNSSRELHGALLDAQLLAEVYLELVGGLQPDLQLLTKAKVDDVKNRDFIHRDPRVHTAKDEELVAHKSLITKIPEPIWNS